MNQKLIPDPFLILVNNPKQPLHARNSFTNRTFWKWIIKKFKKVYFSFEPLVICMSLACTCTWCVCHSYVLVCHSHVTRMYSYVIRLSLVRTRISSVRHPYVVLPWTADNWSIDNDSFRVIHNLYSQLVNGPFTFDRFAKNLIRKFKCFNAKYYCPVTSQYIHGRLEQ